MFTRLTSSNHRSKILVAKSCKPGMCAHQSIKVDLLQRKHLPAVLPIQNAEQWNQTERDWGRLLNLNPSGCFGAFSNSELIGTVTVVVYEERLAWIGMMLVAAELRGRGIGKLLMRTALDHCQHRQIRVAKLDATPAGRPLYESLGFVPELEIERWQGAGRPEIGKNLERHTYEELTSVYSFDEQAVGVSRQKLLESLLEDACVAPALQFDSTRRSMTGYALARTGARASYIGPVVGAGQEICMGLFDSMRRQLKGPIFVDVRPRDRDLTPQLRERGFRKQRSLTRMSFGKENIAESDMVFAIAGPELG